MTTAASARFERGFRRWGRLVYRRRWLALAASLLATAPLLALAPGLRVDNSSKSMLRPGDPARREYDAFLEQFGQDHLVLVLVRTQSLFDRGFLERLRAFHRDLEASVPHLDEVTSLVNARLTRGEGDELVVEDLLEDWPETPGQLARFEQRVRETPLYRDLLVDASHTLTALLLEPSVYSQRDEDGAALAGFDDAGSDADTRPDEAPLLTPGETTQLVEAVLAAAERHRGPDFEIHVAGSTASNNRIAALVMHDVQVFMGGTAVMVGVVLFVLFRRLSAVVLSLLVVFVSLLATFGAMVLLDIPTSIAGQVLAPLLICVGVCDAVHILTLVYDRLDRGASREEALVHALGHSGLPVLMTSLTTAGGLLSFVSGELAQIVNLGIAAPIGIAIAYLLTMLLLPSLLAIVPLRARGRRGPPRLERWLAERLVRLGDFAAAHATAVVVGALALAAAAALGAAQLRFSQDLLRWLPESEPLRIATELVDDSLRGSTALEILVDSRRPAGIQDPALLRGLEAATRAAEAYQKPPLATGKVLSIVDVVKETHRALNENRADHYRIPDARELVAQELLLFESSGSEDLAELVDLPYQVARVTVRTTSADYMHFPDFVEDMRAIFRQALGDSVDLTLTGSAALYARTFSVVNTSMARSYALALVVITPLMVLLIGSFKVGLLAMIPNLLPVLLTLGLMGWLDIRVDNSTLMVGCILVGLAVDDTIHFMHRYRRAFEASGDVRESVRETLASTGVALVMTSLVIGIGFFVMTFAYMNNTRDFGRLACFATAAALLADLVLTPALLASVSRRAGR